MSITWNHETIQLLFIGTWIVLFIVLGIWRLTASPAFKCKTHIPFTILTGALFLLFVYLMDGSKNIGLVAVAVGVITVLNAWSIRYCPECGATAYRPFARPEFCSKCGAALDGSSNNDRGANDLRRP